MKTQKILILTMLMCLMVISSCKDVSGENTPETPVPISLVGIWYDVTNTDDFGTTVTFTETHCIALCYFRHDGTSAPADSIEIYGYYGIGSDSVLTYETLYDSVMQFKMSPENAIKYKYGIGGIHTTSFTFIGDTLFIKLFGISISAIAYPANMYPIYLVRGEQNEE